MKKTFLFLSVFTLLFLASSIAQAVPLLGPAQNYNAFVFGTLDVNNSDSKGRFAAGGDMDLEFYSVGGEASPVEYTIVGGANVDFYSGTVSNGGIFAAGDIYLDHQTINGNVTANGNIYFGAGGGTVNGTATSNSGAASPVDFSSAYNYLSGVSDTLAGMEVNGTTDVKYYAQTQITFTGDEDVNIFDLAGADLNNASNINFIIGDNIAIINVSGAVDDFTTLGFSGASGNESNILWNFHEAVSIALNTTVHGSILAPNADVDFNNGNLWGTLVAGSMTGTGEFHYPAFSPEIAPVPEPSTLILLGSGLVGFLGLRKKYKS